MTANPDTGSWKRLGEMLIQRRIALSPRYHNRGAFCEATGLTYRLVYDIEEARRTNFGSSTLAAIEAAYQLAPGSIRRFTVNGESWESAPAPLSAEDGQFSLFRQLPQTLVAQIAPDYLLIAGRAEAAAAAHGGLVPAGSQVFPAARDAQLAAQWDDLAGQVRGLGMFPDDETLIHRVAETMALAWSVARGRQGGSGSSPVAAGLGPRPARWH